MIASTQTNDHSTPRIVLFVAAALLCAAFCGAAAWKVWPPVDGDGPAYFPAAEEWSLRRPLTNPVWPPPLNDSIDGPGGRRYIYHGFLYALTVGGLARVLGGGPEATIFSAYVLHWLAAVIAALGVLCWIGAPGYVGLFLAFLLPASMLALTIAWHGRVEPLVVLLVGATCLAWRWLESPGRELTAGIATGFAFFTSPAVGILGGCLLSASIIASRDGRIGRNGAAVTAGAALAAAIAVWLFPYPIADWIEGVRRHSRINLSLPMGQGLWRTWWARPELPLLGLSFGLLVFVALARLVENSQRLKATHRIASGLFLLAFTVGLVRIAFLKTEASYNAVVWMPLLACVAVSARGSDFRSWIVVVALMLPAVGLTRSSVLLAVQFNPRSVSFNEVRHRIRELPLQESSVTKGLWIAVDDVTKVTFTNVDDPARKRFFVRQQANTGQADPPAFAGYRLIESRYRPGVTVLGLPFSRTPGGWGFAVYEAQ